MHEFLPFGPAHVAALACVGATAILFIRLARSGGKRLRLALRSALILALIGPLAFELTRAARDGWLRLETVLPLQLCDAAIVLAILGLITLERRVVAILYFWACAGTAIALLTPDLPFECPRWEFLVFFGLHGAVVVSALVLVFGLDVRPPAGSPLRAFLVTNGYAAGVGLVNLIAGTNYMYLCAKPTSPTLLDLMGPWPAYILVGDVIGLILFLLLGLPFRKAAQAGGEGQG